MLKVFTVISYFVETKNTQKEFEVYSYRYLGHRKSLTSQSVLLPFDLFMNPPIENCIFVTRLTSFRKRETGKTSQLFSVAIHLLL